MLIHCVCISQSNLLPFSSSVSPFFHSKSQHMITYSILYIKVTVFKYTIFALGNIFNFFFLEIIQFNSTFRLYYSRPNKIRNVPSSCVILPRRKSHNMHADTEFHFFILVSAFFFLNFP